MNRRQLLIGTAATAAVISLPAMASIPQVPVRSVLDNILSRIKQAPSYGVQNPDVDIMVNTELINKYPWLFPKEDHLFDGSVTNIFYNDDQRRRESYCNWTRSFQAAYSMELCQDLRCIYGFGAEKELVEIMVDEIAMEMIKFKIVAIESGHKIWIKCSGRSTSGWQRRLPVNLRPLPWRF